MSGNLFADGSDDPIYGSTRDEPNVNTASEKWNAENDGLAPIGRQRNIGLTPIDSQRNDLGSQFSVDDFNPFSVNDDHYDEPRPYDNSAANTAAGGKVLTKGRTSYVRNI